MNVWESWKKTEGRYSKRTVVALNKENNALKRNVKCNEDTIKRIEIHTIILNGLREGKTKEEIMQALSNDRYKQYSEYLENWIQDDIAKNKKQIEEQQR